MRAASPNLAMRRRRGSSRGLAEIVGTLMLVVIVVAAATAFSFFVASYQKQVQAEETLNHDRNLESMKVVGVSEVHCLVGKTNVCDAGGAPSCAECFANVSFTIASLDVNPMGITNLYLDHLPVVNYSATVRGVSESPCYNASNKANSTFGVFPCQSLTIPGSSTVVLHFGLGGCENPLCGNNAYWALGPGRGPGNIQTSSLLSLQIVTARGNQFTETLTPPVALISVYYLSVGTTSVPVFDGLNSFQPRSADNSSVDSYNWSVTNDSGEPLTDSHCGDNGVGSGGEFECGGLDGDYSVELTVTNSDGLTGSTSVAFSQQT